MIEHPYDLHSDDDISDVSSSNNFDNTSYNSNNNQHMSDTLNNYFATHRFSITDSLKPYKFSFACHNVRVLMNPAKQSQILSAFDSKHLDVLGVSETKLSLAASIHNFRNINAYVPPASAHNRQERKNTHEYLKSLLSSTLSSNMICILMGDLNVCPNKYFTLISSGLSPSPVEFDLYNFLNYHNFTNNCVVHNDTPLPTHIFYDSVNNNTRYSRLDHIWLSPNFPINDLIHNELWNTEDFYLSDHLMLIMHFSSQNIYSTIANARLNQKKEKRTIIHFRKVTPLLWEDYQKKIDSKIITDKRK